MSEGRIITLMFHRVNDKGLGYSPEAFATYLDYLVQNFPIVMPDEKLVPEKISLCLTFDDAYVDFYLDVYPLLLKHRIKAILAVPVKFIIENTNVSNEIRLSVPYAHDMHATNHQEKVPFCTWQELKEMAESENVVMASHSYSHADMTHSATDLHQEIVVSKQILKQKLNLPINYFVYPYGKMNKHVHKKVCQTYDYGIRIGSALNRGWDDKNKFIYRVDAEHLWPTQRPLDKRLIRKLGYKYWMNRLRSK